MFMIIDFFTKIRAFELYKVQFYVPLDQFQKYKIYTV